jgi:hypothetical protein
MFSLFRKSQPRHLTPALSHALVSDGLPPGMDPSSLSVVLDHGSYSGRNVDYFRVFDPVRVAERHLQVRRFTDLDTAPDLVIGSGHVEGGGEVVLSRRGDSTFARSTPVRAEVDRSDHPDDERVVFPDRTHG